ncbi:hypothetical protein [Cohnella nanjingensis]|uniref:Uncharacterized protein n=1 Tax=Cohnella nanjingensis TaxID=1387779 RepID=A0A7X0RT80_9BACL|nr:hypothetical protein [Cohnella nanjingensis]MBB6673262.1 hypothetical protein [Cohnella nanjingensis]
MKPDNPVHLLNGDAAEAALRETGIPGMRFVWREIYTAGPLAADWRALWRTERRMAWLETRYGIPRGDFVRESFVRGGVWATAMALHAPLAVWADPDLFDQTIFMAVCWGLVQEEATKPGQTLLLVRLPAGSLDALAMRAAWSRREAVTPAAIGAAARAWGAYVSGEPAAVRDWLERDGEAQGLSALANALRFHLLRFPGEDGLGIVERETLLALDEAAEEQAGQESKRPGAGLTALALFGRVAPRVPLFGLGDLQYWRCLERLAESDPPLVRVMTASGAARALPPRLPRLHDDIAMCEALRYQLTSAGREVLDGVRVAPSGTTECGISG